MTSINEFASMYGMVRQEETGLTHMQERVLTAISASGKNGASFAIIKNRIRPTGNEAEMELIAAMKSLHDLGRIVPFDTGSKYLGKPVFKWLIA